MKPSVWKILNEPYPFNFGLKKLLWLLPAIFILGTLFLYIFQPFNNEWEEHRFPFYIICTIHGLTATLCLLPFFFIASIGVKDKNSWTIAQEFLLMLFAFITVGVGNFLIRDIIYINEHNNWQIKYLIEEIKHAFAVGLVFYPLFIWFNNSRLKSKYKKEGQSLSQDMPTQITKQQRLVTIHNAAGTPELQVPEKNLLFIKSEGNYIKVYFKKDNIEIKMIRNTLTSVAGIVPDFFSPHRSYLVNLNNINRIGGNSQGYTLHFEDLENVIPVSRNKKESLLQWQRESKATNS